MTLTSKMLPRRVSRGGLATVMLAALAPALLSQSPDRARTEAFAQRAIDRLQALQQEADALASQERTLLGDLRKLEVDRQLKAEELRQVTADGKRSPRSCRRTAQRMRDLERQESSGRPELRSPAR